MLIANHRVPAAAFTLLAHGRADGTVMRLLRAGRLSKQVLLIRAVLDAARPHRTAVATASLGEVVALIDEVQRRAPAAAAEVLGYPLVGAWAAQCLRRLRRPAPAAVPLWVELSHLGAVAAAAGIRAGLEVTVPVPLRGGAVCLPTLGRARLGGGTEWGVATVRGGRGGYEIVGRHATATVPADPHREASGWEALRRLEFTEQDRTMTVFLDDTDPYRSHGLTADDRLDGHRLARWRQHLSQAWTNVVHNHPERVAELATTPVTLVPLADAPGLPHVSATTRTSAGAMALTPPPDAFTMSLSLVHELQHSKLGALLDLVELYDSRERRRFYSPWRGDPRPIGGLLQGAYAFLAVTAFWERHATRDNGMVAPRVAEYEFVRGRAQVRTALRDLADSGALTSSGARFVSGLREAVEGLDRRPVADEAARLGRLVRDDHRIGWRLRNLRVHPDTVTAAAEAWRDGAPRPPDHPPPEQVTGVTPTYAGQPRHELVQRRLGGEPVTDHPGADGALVAGDYPAAARGYLAGLRTHPERLDLWAGLAVARLRCGPPAAARAYGTEPELVVAVYQRLAASGAPPDPDALAGWLAG